MKMIPNGMQHLKFRLVHLPHFLKVWKRTLSVVDLWRYLSRYLFPERVIFYVYTDGLVMLRFAPWPFRSVIERNTWKLDEYNEAQDIAAALRLLRDLINSPRLNSCKVRMILSGMSTLSIWLPWHEGIKFRDWKVLATQKLNQFYGVTASEGVIIDDASPGSGRLAFAIKQSAVQVIKECFTQKKMQSIQPFPVVAFNRWRHLFKKYHGWFIVVEPGMLHCMNISCGALNGMRSVQVSVGWENSFHTQLMREALLMGISDADAQPGYIYWPEQPKFMPVGMAQAWLNLASEAEGIYGLAWCALW